MGAGHLPEVQEVFNVVSIHKSQPKGNPDKIPAARDLVCYRQLDRRTGRVVE